MRLPMILIGALAALGLSAGASLACSCLRAESAASHAAMADVVFAGRAIDTRRLGPNEAATSFRVEAALKGRTGGVVQVGHGLESAACGVTFRPGERVLVLASRGPRGELRTSLCSRPQFPEAEYRRALAGGTLPPPRPGPDWPPSAGRCRADRAEFAVGRRYTPGLGRQAQNASGAAVLRVRLPGQPYTQDYSLQRLNLDLDRRGRVAGVVCG